MKNTLTELLKSFSESDFIKFKDFVNSPYHNKIKNAGKLFSVLQNNPEDFESGIFTKEELWKKIFPGKKYNYGTMKNLLHELYKLAEKFIMYENFNLVEIEKFKHLYIGLFQRKMFSILDLKDKYFEKDYSDEKNIISEKGPRFIYQDLFYLYQLKMWKDHMLNPALNMKSERIKMDNIFTSYVLINLFFNYSLLKGYSLNDKEKTDYINLSNFILDKISDENMEILLQEIRKSSPLKYTIVKSHFLAYKAISNENNISDYDNFKEFLFDNIDDLPSASKLDLIGLLDHSLYFSKAIKDKTKEKLDLLEFKFNNNLLFQNHEMLSGGELLYNLKPFFDNNRADKFKEILAKYIEYIITENKETYLRIANAQYHFMKSEFDKSLEEISKINTDVFEVKLIMKRLLLMIYYELNEYELFLSTYDSYKHFIRSIKFNSILRKNQNTRAKTFFDLINELFKLRLKYDNYNAGILQKKITDLNIDHKIWLLKKLKDLGA